MGPEQMPEGYSTVENPRVSYAPQAGGLTVPRERTLGGRVQVLQSQQVCRKDRQETWVVFSDPAGAGREGLAGWPQAVPVRSG